MWASLFCCRIKPKRHRHSRPCWRRGSSARDASRGVLADSCLRVPLRVPPCGSIRLQRTTTFAIQHPMSLGSQWFSPKAQHGALGLDMCMPRCQTRLCGQGAHLNKEPVIWCAASCQTHPDFASRHIAPPGHKRSGFLVESAASQRHVEYFSVRLGRSRGLGWTWEDRHAVRSMSRWSQASSHDFF